MLAWTLFKLNGTWRTRKLETPDFIIPGVTIRQAFLIPFRLCGPLTLYLEGTDITLQGPPLPKHAFCSFVVVVECSNPFFPFC